MFDALSPWIIVAAASLASASASCLPILLPKAFPRQLAESDESWRDEGPFLIRIVRQFAGRFPLPGGRTLSKDKRSTLQDRLNAAGIGYSVTPDEIVVFRWVLTGIGVLVALLILLVYRVREPFPVVALLIVPALAYFYVDIWLRDAVKRRHQKIQKEFPFFLDIVALSMKAGLAFPAAIQQATSQLPNGPVREELSRLIREVRTGLSRSVALERLARRIRMASVSNFVAVVAQAEESGGSLTNALNEQARQRRRERFQRAEKLANQAPVKMLFPLVAFLFPVTFMIIAFPIYQQLAESGLFQ